MNEFDKLNELNWCELDNETRLKYIEIYFSLYTSQNTLRLSKEELTKIKLNSINGIKSNYVGIKSEHNYIHNICINCGKRFELSHRQIMQLRKDINKTIYCSKQCASSYVTKNRHNTETIETKQKINKKISDTLKQKELKLSDDEKEIRSKKLSTYWKKLSPEERSIRNKKSAVKGKLTKLERYGNENYNNAVQARLTYSNKYKFTPTYNQQHLTSDTLKIIRDKKLFKEFILSIPLEERCIYTISNKLGISRSRCSGLLNSYKLYDEISVHRNLSKPQIELQNYIKSLYSDTVKVNDRSIIVPYELDIYIPEKNLAIEYNGSYWHTTDKIDKKAHYNKSKLCEEKGIRLIHIFEYEWENERQRPILENIIKSALGITKTIYARKLKVVEKSSSEMREFFNTNNIQGFRGGKTAICLVDDNDEVYMSYIMGSAFFGKGKYEWEVIRGATKLGYTVVGGASKIWKYFIKTYNPNSCVYYVDYNYFNGNSLKNLPQMQFITTQFSFKNYWVDENIVKNREPHRHKEIKQLELERKVVPIYNAGTKVYIWKK